MSKYKFILNNILHPAGKINIALGYSNNAIRVLNSFNKRTIRKAFLKNKKFNIALLPLLDFTTPEAYIKSVKGKNSADYFSRRCEKAGYTFRAIDPNSEIEGIFNINTSSKERQGQVMGASYLEKIESWPSGDGNVWYGVYSPENQLVAYIWTIEMNEMVLLNRILGHHDHLKNNIMYFMLTSFVCETILQGKVKYIMYDTFGKVQNGLVMYKKRIGFKPFTVNFSK